MPTAKPGTATTTDTFGYNETGDTVSRAPAGLPAHTLTWDPEDRLASDTANGQTTSFVYTPDGSRLLRRDPTHTTLYLPDGTELRWQRSTTTVVGTRYHAHTGRTVAVRQGSAVTWLASDHHNTAMFAVNATTLNVDRRRWLPFGALRGTIPTAWPGDRGFVNGTIDPSTGLTHVGARDYDPATGRFISVDPIMDLADPQQLHGYTYANNNPATFSDPTGLKYFVDDNSASIPHHGSSDTAKDNAAAHAKNHQKANTLAKLDTPVLVNGQKVPKKSLDGLRRSLNYHGSDDFTYADAIEFAAQGGQQWVVVCQAMGGSTDECSLPSGFWDLVMDVVKFAYELTPIADVINCASGKESCLWLAASVIPPLKGLKAADKLADAAKAAGKACSFTGDTEVLMADGTTRPIRDARVGDQVLATDPETGEQGARAVTAVWAHEDTVLDLELEGGATVATTDDHPFWNDTDKAWQRADQLDPGDQLRTATGQQVRVGGLRSGNARAATAYNLTIDDIHTYSVKAAGDPVLVHNTCGMAISADQLQKKFKHAADFGVSGNWNKVNAEKFEAALKAHVGDPNNLRMRGTYHGDEVIHHLNPHTGVNVMHKLDGTFVSGWRLNSLQLNNVMMKGSL